MSILIRKKGTHVEYWIEQEDWDKIIELKMTKDYERINPTNAKKTDKPTVVPNEVIEFIKTKEIEPENKPKYKPKKVK